MELIVLLAAVSLAAILSEFALSSRGSRLQSSLGPVVLVFVLFALLTAAWLILSRQISIIPTVIFWYGAFLTWFGIRSHIESSILLRMLYILRQRPLDSTELLEEYRRHYNPGERLNELYRAGLLVPGNGKPLLTPRGRMLARIVSLLR
jgi:hypothetical protein